LRHRFISHLDEIKPFHLHERNEGKSGANVSPWEQIKNQSYSSRDS
jgi:hypothetical protein